MNTVTRWNPFKELENLQNSLHGSLFGLAPSSQCTPSPTNTSVTVPEWSPLVDIAEDEKEYSIKVELPGVDKKDVSVRVESGVLYIAGERRQENEVKDRKLHRVERYYGNFERSFRIPQDANAAQIDAAYKDGVLTVSLAKAEEAKPKQIDIKVV